MVSGWGVSLTLRSRELMYPGGSAQALRGAGFGLTRVVPRSLGPASSSPGTGPKAAAGGGTTEWSGRSWKCPSLLPCASRAQQTHLFFRTSSVKDSSFVEKMKKTVSFLFVLGPGGCAGASSRRPASLAGRRSGREAGSTPCVRTFWANQSLEPALLLLGQFTPLFACLLLEQTKL